MTKTAEVKENNGTKLLKVGIKGVQIEGSAWSIAGEMVIESNTFEGTTQKEQSAIFTKHWESQIDPAVIPKKCLDRQGNPLDLFKDDGSIKMSSWNLTKTGMKAMNEMTKLTRTYAEMIPEGEESPRGMHTAIKEFFPEGKAVSARVMREKIGKIEKNPLAIIERAVKQIEIAVDKVGYDEVTRMDACYEILVRKFSEWKVKSTLKVAA